MLTRLLQQHTSLQTVPAGVPLVELGLDSIAAMVLRQKLLAGLHSIVAIPLDGPVNTTAPAVTPTRLHPSRSRAHRPFQLDFAEFESLTAAMLGTRVQEWVLRPFPAESWPDGGDEGPTAAAGEQPVVYATAPPLKRGFQTTGRAWPSCGNPGCLPIPERDGRFPDCQIKESLGFTVVYFEVLF